MLNRGPPDRKRGECQETRRRIGQIAALKLQLKPRRKVAQGKLWTVVLSPVEHFQAIEGVKRFI
jgi:hypothetical protein